MPNPFDFGRTMLQEWENKMSEALEKLTHDETFMKGMSQSLAGSLDSKAQVGSQMEKYLQSINMPTRTDLERMLKYLQRIEKKLLDLEDQLAEQQPGAPNLGTYPAVPPSAGRATPSARTTPATQTAPATRTAPDAPAKETRATTSRSKTPAGKRKASRKTPAPAAPEKRRRKP